MEVVKGFSMEEYLTIFVALIYGHVISHFFSNWGSWIQNRKSIRIDIRHLVLTVAVFVLIVDIWWTIFNRTALVTANKILFFVSLTVPINLYVLSNILFPKLESKYNDMSVYFRRNERLIYLLLGVNFLLNALIAVSIGEIPLFHWENLFRLIAFTMCLIVSLVNRKVVSLVFLSIGVLLIGLHVFFQGETPTAVGLAGFSFVDYITVFSAFIYGYVATKFLTGWAFMIQHIRKIYFGKEYFAWTVLVFGLLSEGWWVSWKREPFAARHLGFFLLSLCAPLVYYMLTTILFPVMRNDPDDDLTDYFRANEKIFYGLFGILFVVSLTLANTMEEQNNLVTNYFRLGAIGLAIWAYKSNSALVHRIVLGISWVAFIIHITVN